MAEQEPSLATGSATCIKLALPYLRATDRLAEAIAPLLQKGDVVELQGQVGVGKTTFVRGLIRSLGGTGAVPSPTFNLLYVYELGAITIWHFDLFRVGSLADTYELGIEDALDTGVSLIEWPEIMAPITPKDRLEIKFSYAGLESRHVTIHGHGSWTQRLPHLESLVDV